MWAHLNGLYSVLQHLNIECPKIVKQLEIKETYQSMFNPKITLNLAKTKQKIVNLMKTEE